MTLLCLYQINFKFLQIFYYETLNIKIRIYRCIHHHIDYVCIIHV